MLAKLEALAWLPFSQNMKPCCNTLKKQIHTSKTDYAHSQSQTRIPLKQMSVATSTPNIVMRHVKKKTLLKSNVNYVQHPTLFATCQKKQTF